MNCHRARMALIERDLQLLTLGHERALDEHLGGCPACAETAAREQRLVHDLAALHSQALIDVDVRVRVLGEISAGGLVERRWVPARQLGWAAAAAVAAAVVLAVLFVPHAAGLRTGAARLFSALPVLADAGLSVLGALKDILLLPVRLLASAAELLASLGPVLGRLEPWALGALSTGVAVMGLTILFVVGRDLGRPLWAAEWKENR